MKMKWITPLVAAGALHLGILPAAAQSVTGAVACVGSELEAIASTSPVRRVVRTDEEVVYRVGVDLGNRDAVEGSLRSQLDGYAEIWCAWSEVGDNHIIIIQYTGVIRLDLTIDPEDPRFQAFGVGYGTSREEAQQFATTLDDRFSSYNDGSGYEVLVRETWSAGSASAEIGVPAAPPTIEVPEIELAGIALTEERGDSVAGRDSAGRTAGTLSTRSTEETCAGKPVDTACWMAVADHPACYVWNPSLRSGQTVTWTAGCSDGFVQGVGTLGWTWDGGEGSTEGPYVDGKPHGNVGTLIWTRDGESSSEGPYVDGKRHGKWVFRHWDGSSEEGPYIEGEKTGNWVDRWPSGEVHRGGYVDGMKEGHWVLRFADGRVREGPYVDGMKEGHWVLRFPDGRVHEGPYVNGKMNGNWVQRFPDGLVQEGPFVDGERHGQWVLRSADGGVQEGPYVEGKKHGDWVERFPSGLVWEGPYVEGERNGNWIIRGGPGDVDRGPYVDGRRHGEWVDWDPDGRVYLWPYVDGQSHGIHVACKLGERANLVWVNVFDQDEVVDRYYDYDDIGDPQLARAAAAACARVLSLEKPTPIGSRWKEAFLAASAYRGAFPPPRIPDPSE